MENSNDVEKFLSCMAKCQVEQPDTKDLGLFTFLQDWMRENGITISNVSVGDDADFIGFVYYGLKYGILLPKNDPNRMEICYSMGILPRNSDFKGIQKLADDVCFLNVIKLDDGRTVIRCALPIYSLDGVGESILRVLSCYATFHSEVAHTLGLVPTIETEETGETVTNENE